MFAILLVDDEPAVQHSLLKLLRGAGYDAEAVKDGLAALMKVRTRATPYAAVVCDVMMPMLDGLEFYQQLLEQHPETAARVIFLTAWADAPRARQSFEKTGRPVLQKPVLAEELLAAVANVTKESG